MQFIKVGLIGCTLGVLVAMADEPKTVAKQAFSGFQERTNLVISNEKDWQQVWDKLNLKVTPKPERPNIDFKKESLLLVTQGQQTTGGYAITVVSVEADTNKPNAFRAVVEETKPAAGAMRIMSLTAPFHLVLLPCPNAQVQVQYRDKGSPKPGQ